MKKMFLAATLVLGIAGAIAAKSTTKSVTYYFKDPNSIPTAGVCTANTFSIDPCNGTVNDCTYDFGGTTGVQQLYTASDCLTKVKKP